jgi:hypothetical protein
VRRAAAATAALLASTAVLVATTATSPRPGSESQLVVASRGLQLEARDAPTTTTTIATTTTTAPPTTTTTAPPPPPTTTTTEQPPPPEPAREYSGASAGQVNGYPCGGDLPPCWVLERESGGDPTAQNPTSTASGLWQFLDGTWAGYGGYAKARHAPPDVQNEKARITWAGGSGCFHWSAC